MKKSIFVILLFLFGLAVAYSDTVIVGGPPTTNPVVISEGGTGATTAAGAKTNLGLDNVATFDNITGYNKHRAAYASFNFYTTSSPTFLNLSTTTFQALKPFATSESSSNITTNATTGVATIGSGGEGLYKVLMRMSIRANEGSTVYFQTVKNGSVIVNRTLKKMGPGPMYHPTMINYSGAGLYGSSASGIANTYTPDGVYYLINEGSGSPGIVATATFNGINVPKRLICSNCQYDSSGAAHAVMAQIYMPVFGRYTGMTTKSYISGARDDFPNKSGDPLTDPTLPFYREFDVPTPLTNYALNGQVKMRFRHSNNGSTGHSLFIDALHCQDALESYYLEHSEIVRLVDGDTIQIRIGTDTAGTTFYRYVTGLKLEKIGR